MRGLCPLNEPPGLPLPLLLLVRRFDLPLSDKLSGLAPNEQVRLLWWLLILADVVVIRAMLCNCQQVPTCEKKGGM